MEDKKKIMVIGHVGYGSVGLSAIEKAFGDVTLKNHDKIYVTVVDDARRKYTIDVNGTKYERIEHEKPKSSKFGMAAAMLAALTPTMDFGGSNYERKRPAVDIVKEYGLIELKQSKLSRNDRDWVKWQFEMNYKKV